MIVLAIVTHSRAPQAETRLETIVVRYTPMFRYWCLSAEQRYANERPEVDRTSDRDDRVETCERLSAVYVDQLKHLTADADATDEAIIDVIQFIGSACIDMQRIGTGRARAEGACPLASGPEKDTGQRIEEVFGPDALRNYRRGFRHLGRNRLLQEFPPGSLAQTLTGYLSSHGYRCRANQSRTSVEHRCIAQYGELIYEMFRPSMLASFLPSVAYHADADGRLEDVEVDRFEEGQAVFGPYPE